MNLFRRRCGCGAIFALVHLRDRSQQCTACQRRESASLSHAREAETLGRRYMEQLARMLRAKANPAAMHACEGDLEQVGRCEMRQQAWYMKRHPPGSAMEWEPPVLLSAAEFEEILQGGQRPCP